MANKPFEVRMVTNRLPAITSALGRQVQREVMATALRIKGRAVVAMHEPKSGPVYRNPNMGKPHQASAPGEAPAVDTGALVGSLSVRSQGYRAEVYTNSEYGLHLEYGTTRMAARPFMGPAAKAESDRFFERVQSILKGLK